MEDLLKLKQKILNYSLGSSEIRNLGYTRILLQVCGNAGHGKSSFINSLMYALHGGVFQLTASEASASESQGGHNRKRTSYDLTDNIILVDNRGFGKSDSNEKEEIYAQLGNLQLLDEEVVWQKSFDERMTAITEAKLNSNDLLLPIFIHSAECPIRDEMKGEFKEFLTNTQKLTGFLPIIILSKQYLGDVRTLQQQYHELGMERVFPVENYTSQDHMKTCEKDKTFLTILCEALDLVEFKSSAASSFGTPEEEHLRRVQMVLSIAHKNEIENVAEELKDKWEKEHMAKPKKEDCKIL